MKIYRKWVILLAMMLLPMLLGGCMMSVSVEDLYSLPSLPEEYQALSERINEVLSAGAEYTSPTSGTNLQSVQLEDLNGDGNQEALAFFRNTSEERPLKIYIFRAVEGGYEQAAVIEGSGTSIHSIRYEDMDRDGVKELLVSWRVSAEVQAMAVYSLDNMEPALLMSAAYARYDVVDLDGDDMLELVVLRSDETGVSLADYYDWDESSLLLQSSARLSMSVAELQWVQTGALSSGETAVFVTGRVTGVEETSRAVTDILVYRQPELTNIVVNSDTGVSSQIARFLNLQPTDINNDGVTEVPMPAQLPSEGDTNYWKIFWFSYDADGTSTPQALTYHNLTDSWYLLIPKEWDGRFTVRQDNTSSTAHATTFYTCSDGNEVGDELFTIYSFTGSNRDNLGTMGGRSILRRQPNVIYAVYCTQTYADWRYAVGQDILAGRFSPILTQWSTDEN